MRNGFKLALITLPIIALGAGYLAYTVKTKAPPARIEAHERALPVRVITARRGTPAPRVRGYGLVAPAETFEAIAQVGGTVAWINPDLKRGAILPKGAVLLRIAPEDFSLAVAQAEANIRAAQARLDELAVSEENQRAALEIENAALALKQADLTRAEKLNAAGTLPQAGLDAARAALLGQRQKVQSLDGALALLPTQRAVQEENIAVAKAALATAQLNLARTEITLPFTARAASVAVEVGRFLRQGEVAATFDGTEVAEVEAQVPVAQLRALLSLAAPDAAAYAADPTAMTAVLQGLDLGATLRLDLGDDALTWPAHVARVSDKIDPKTGTLGVIVEVEGAYAGATPGTRPPLTKGMFVEVAITAPPVAGLVVPRAALNGGKLRIVTAGDNRLAEVDAQVLFVKDEIAVIGGGLSEGDRVVVSDLVTATPGMLLAPVEDTALAAQLEAAQ
ncbi:MAG TPA: efflux RND transporter periplasmic adaptor subunit [Rhodobacterales bacterium]|nr:efflux RND transporter periplasmic adaptor subunit [Rhodobacterales bacterium]